MGASSYGPKLIIVTGLLLTGISLSFSSLADSVTFLLICRFLAGIGSSFSSIAIMGLASSWFATRIRGMALGFIVGGSGIAMMVTGWLVPVFNFRYEDNGWRYSWLALGFILIGIAFLAAFTIKNHPKEKGLTPVGADETYFSKEQDKDSKILTIRDIFRKNPTRILAFIYFCFGMSYIIYTMFFVNYMIIERNVNQSLAGSIWGTVGFLSIFSAVIWGYLSDKLGRGPILVFVFLVQAISYLLPVFAVSITYLWLSAIAFGLVAWSVPGIVASCCGDFVGAKNASAVLGCVTFLNGLGSVLGPAIAGFIKESSSSFSGAFLLGALLACCGAFGSAILSVYFSPRSFSG